MLNDVLLLVLAFLLGSFPTGFLLGRLLKKTDLRKIGTRNVGAMNTFLNVSFIAGLTTLAVDVGKGALSVILAREFGAYEHLGALAVVLVVVGHNFSPFLRFSGGKGFGALVGTLLVVSPLTILIIYGIVGLVSLVIRDASAGSGIGMLALPLVLLIREVPLAFVIAYTVVLVPILYRHKRDFRTLIRRGKEERELP